MRFWLIAAFTIYSCFSVKAVESSFIVELLPHDSTFKLEKPPKKVFQYDSNFVEDMSASFMVGPEFSFPNYSLRLEYRALADVPDSLEDYKFQMEPNLPGLIGISLGYRALSFSFAFRQPTDPILDSVYGKSEYWGISLKMKIKRYYFDGMYRNFKGFSDRLSTEVGPKKDTSFYINSDLVSKYFKVRARRHFFNADHFSYPSSYNFSERQLKTAVSLFATGQAYFHEISTEGNLLHPDLDSAIGKDANVLSMDVLGIGIGPGVALNVVFLKRCFMSFSFAVGADFQWQKYQLLTQSTANEFRIAPLLDSRFGLGYNSRVFYAGLTVSGDQTSFSFKKYRMVSEYIVTTITMGIRLRANPDIDNIYYGGNELLKKHIGFGVE